ncbi:MAG: hypothetical protein OK457_00690 [Thaumarchaeota archaeon]|nr:hypothetical protein [Nitrososphaerota archaeon]
MKTFKTIRTYDVSGVSGTGVVAEGVVAEGVELSDGQVVLHWLTDTTSIAIYRTMAEMLKIHGHDGLTRVQFDENMSRI